MKLRRLLPILLPLLTFTESSLLTSYTPLMLSAYYFPEKVRPIIVKNFFKDNLFNDEELYELARTQVKALQRDTFYAALHYWRLKHLIKRTFGIREADWHLDRMLSQSLEQMIVSHYRENMNIISIYGQHEEMIGEMYFAFKLFHTWSPAASILLSTFIFGGLNRTNLVTVGPVKEEEYAAYAQKLGKISIPADSDLFSYIDIYSGGFPLSKRIKRVKEEDKGSYSLLFNPYGYNASSQSNAFKHILAMQQWIHIHEIRLNHIIKTPHSPLESLLLIKTSNSHINLLMHRLLTYPTYFRKFLMAYFEEKMNWKIPFEDHKIEVSGCDDIDLNLKVSAQNYEGMFGLPDALRVLLLMRVQEDEANFVDFVDAEYHIGFLQQRIFISLFKGKELEDPNLYLPIDSLRDVCFAWITYWTIVIGKLGHFNHLLRSSPFIFSIVRDYFILKKLPSGHSHACYLDAIEKAILFEANVLLAFCKLFSHNPETIEQFIDNFESYEESLESYLMELGIKTMAFEANRIKIALLKQDFN